MSLDKEITEQYRKRLHTEAMYNSPYARFAEEERTKICTRMVKKYLPSPQSVLEIGAGQGHNVEMLRACGFKEIILNELLPDRVAIAKKNHPELKILSGNFLHLTLDQKFDCVFQSTVFTSVLSDNDRREIARKMWELLNPGGIILWYDFIYNNPRNKDVRKVTVKETLSLFPEAVLHDIRKVTLAPPLGRRVGNFYSLLNLPFLRSHILAIFQKH